MAVDPKAPVTSEYLDGAIEPIIKLLDKILKKLDGATTERKHMNHQINDLKVDTPTQKEFNKLKQKVDRHHTN